MTARVPLLDLETFKVETPIEQAWADWRGFVTVEPPEMSRVPKLRLAAGSAVDPMSFSRDHAFTAPVQSLGCYFLRNVHFAGLLYPFKNGALLDDGSHLSKVNADWLTGYPTHKPGMRGELLPTRFERPVLAVAGPGCATYGHWIIDFLPRLAVAKATLGSRFRELRFLILDRTPDWAMQLLATFFGITEEDCIRFELGMDEFYCGRVCHPTYAHSYPFRLHSFIPRFYRSHFPPPTPGGTRKLCVTRRSVSNRTFERRDAFEALAIARDFEIVDPVGLTINQQADLFGSAAVVIGEYGSALHNSVFCPDETIIGVVNAPGIEQTGLCSAFGQPILYMPGRWNDDGSWTLTDDQFDAFFAGLTEMQADQAADRQADRAPTPEWESGAVDRALSGPFYLETQRGTRLQFDIRTGEVVWIQVEEHDRFQPLMAYVPKFAPATAYLSGLICQDQVIGIPGDNLAGPILALRLTRECEGIAAGFCHPFTGRYLSATIPLQEDGRAPLVIDRAEQHGPETFILVPVHPSSVSPTLAAVLRSIDARAASTLNGPAMARALAAHTDTEPDSVLAAALNLLLIDQLEWLARALLIDPKLALRLAAAARPDLFCMGVIPQLCEWASLGPRRPGAVAARQSNPAAVGIMRETGGAGRQLCRFARAAVTPKQGLCILAVARSGYGILDWVAHHRSIGVQQIILYCGALDADLPLYQALDAHDFIKLVVVDGAAVTTDDSYWHAFNVLPDILDYRWTLVVEVDDFLMFDRRRWRHIGAFLDWQEMQPVDAIALNMLVFGSSGQRAFVDRPLTRRMTRRYPWVDGLTRTMVRTGLAAGATPHHPLYDSRREVLTRNASRAIHQTEPGNPAVSGQPEAHVVWIHRYMFKSADETLWAGGPIVTEESGSSMSWTKDRNWLQMFVDQFDSADFDSDSRIIDIQDGTAALKAAMLGHGSISFEAAAAIARLKAGVERTRQWLRTSQDTDDTLHAAARLLLW